MTVNVDDELIVIERAPSTALAEELQSLLEAEGIKSCLDPYSTEEVIAGELYTEFTGVDVLVRRADAAWAHSVLADVRRAGRYLKALYDKKERRESKRVTGGAASPVQARTEDAKAQGASGPGPIHA
jgi:hypothetical protein